MDFDNSLLNGLGDRVSGEPIEVPKKLQLPMPRNVP
jgi:hypothetical protein